MKKFLTNRVINLRSRQRMLKCYVHPVLLYRAEAMTFSARAIAKIKASEMWFHI